MPPVLATAFFEELEALTARVYADRRPEDLRQMDRIERWGKALSVLGYATAWICLNPLSIVAIGLGVSCRWMIVAHHVLHRGFDAYPNARARHKSRSFGRGLYRWLHWCDWIPVKAWSHEHNVLHHYRLGEVMDPDVPEITLTRFTNLPLPHFLKYLILLLLAMTWKWGYYGPSTLQADARKTKAPAGPFNPFSPATWNPLHPVGRQVWLQSWLPHFAIRFGILPLPFLALGKEAWLAVLLNTIGAEIFTNLHTFLVIVPNHAGGDVPRFVTPPQDKNEHRLRQILGSVNYRTGGDVNDFLHGWLNYQIEHHLWPDLSLGQYQRWQRPLKELCERHEVPYRQDSVWRRLARLVENVMGHTRMPVFSTIGEGLLQSRINDA